MVTENRVPWIGAGRIFEIGEQHQCELVPYVRINAVYAHQSERAQEGTEQSYEEVGAAQVFYRRVRLGEYVYVAVADKSVDQCDQRRAEISVELYRKNQHGESGGREHEELANASSPESVATLP